MKERPGVMFYFDKWEDIKNESDEICAAFFRAAMDYAQHGVLPDFKGGYKLAWSLIQSEIDRDAERYADISVSRRYSRYCGVEKSAGREPLNFEDWKRSISTDNERDERQRTQPTTTTTPPTSTPTPTPTESSSSTFKEEISSSSILASAYVEEGEPSFYDYTKQTEEEAQRKKQAQLDLLAAAGIRI